MSSRLLYWLFVGAVAAALVGFGAPSWVALGAGLVIALVLRVDPPRELKAITTYALQLGIVALGAGMNLGVVMRVGGTGTRRRLHPRQAAARRRKHATAHLDGYRDLWWQRDRSDRQRDRS